MTELPLSVTPELQALAVSVRNACAMPADTDEGFTIHAVLQVYGLLWGQLRGQVPDVLPRDLRAVLVGAATRYNLMLGKARGIRPVGDDEALSGLPDFGGFTLPELLVIWRYRRRLA
jgi:hypothetical protein